MVLLVQKRNRKYRDCGTFANYINNELHLISSFVFLLKHNGNNDENKRISILGNLHFVYSIVHFCKKICRVELVVIIASFLFAKECFFLYHNEKEEYEINKLNKTPSPSIKCHEIYFRFLDDDHSDAGVTGTFLMVISYLGSIFSVYSSIIDVTRKRVNGKTRTSSSGK